MGAVVVTRYEWHHPNGVVTRSGPCSTMSPVVEVAPMMFRRRFSTWTVVAALGAGLVAACGGGDDGQPPPSGTVGGRVLMTLDGPLIGAQVSVDHLEYERATIQVRTHLADLTTDDAGHFETPTGLSSGFFRITTHGGRFTDYATGAQVVLDPADGLTALLYTDGLEDLTTGLVTPVTALAYQLIATRTAAGTDASVIASHALVNEHLDQHFGDLHWERIAPADLGQPQASPTDEVRAAFILASWSLVARDIATAAGATVQEVNPYTLAIDLGRDLAAPPFDGDDGNDRASGTGIQLATPAGAAAVRADARAPWARAGPSRRLRRHAAYGAGRRADLAHQRQRPQRAQPDRPPVADTLSLPRAIANNSGPHPVRRCVRRYLDRNPPTWGATPTAGRGGPRRGAHHRPGRCRRYRPDAQRDGEGGLADLMARCRPPPPP
ncbi:MAG: hypothetical protein R3B06_08000 [Kofleriaceae bacterium]